MDPMSGEETICRFVDSFVGLKKRVIGLKKGATDGYIARA